MSINFTVHGAEPAPQGSKRSVGHNRFVEASKKLMPYREAIISQIIRDGLSETLLEGPVCVRAVFTFERPKAHYGTGKNALVVKDNAPYYKATAPDSDKLCRALGDALQQGGIVRDDAQIVVWHATKVYGPRHMTVVEVIPMPR